ncbi:MAG: GMC family oxidoreductase [Anaerolineales bacterium]|nr:MAG: GMC family oxidoreductase [Anaerolineales bacterium]
MTSELQSSKQIYDFVIIGSGFGGSVSAMRLAEKGYRVLVLERGLRYEDEDFPKNNWLLWKFLWMPALRFFGFWELTLLRDVMAFSWSGVGGGSLGYANVLVDPDDKMYEVGNWAGLNEWKSVLAPHFDTAKRMLGRSISPSITEADKIMRSVSEKMGRGSTFKNLPVGVYFGTQGIEVDDPFFNGQGPLRSGCTFCGGCMIGCRENAKNTLPKNYLYFAEKLGVEIRPEAQVTEISKAKDGVGDGARYRLRYKNPKSVYRSVSGEIYARNVIVAAGVIGTLNLLLQCRDVSRTLPELSVRLGENVRTNSEALLGVTDLDPASNHTEGIAINTVFHADDVTHIEPFRFPEGSSFLSRLLVAPMIEAGEAGVAYRLWLLLLAILRNPWSFIKSKFDPAWGRRTFLILLMQTEDNLMRVKLGRSLLTLFRLGLTSDRGKEKQVPAEIPIGHQVVRAMAAEIDGLPMGNIVEGALNASMTAHILGGCLMGSNDAEGVVNKELEVFNYPGLYIVDGSIIQANPGLNPTLTITAMAEYAMSGIPAKN